MGAEARAAMLGRIRLALRGADAVALPAALAFEERAQSPEALAQRFRDELQVIGGETAVVGGSKECADAIGAYLRNHGVRSLGMQASTMLSAIGDMIRGVDARLVEGMPAAAVERFDASLLEGQALIADTGSVVLRASSYAERLLPYLPRICFIVSPLSRLYPTLSASALETISTACEARHRGEAVIVTGPSRTADIEKSLVLGAHGPAHLAVFLIS